MQTWKKNLVLGIAVASLGTALVGCDAGAPPPPTEAERSPEEIQDARQAQIEARNAREAQANQSGE